MISINRFKKITRYKKGQAIIETLLMLVISIILATGLLRQFSEPFNEFIEGLFSADGYYACLFQTASLPGSPYCSYPQLRTGDTSWAQGGSSGNWESSGSWGGSGSWNSGGSQWSSNSFPTTPTNSNNSSSSFSNNNYYSSLNNSTSPTLNDWGNPNSGFTGSPLDLTGGSKRFLAGNNNNRLGGAGGFFGNSNLSSNRFEDSENTGAFNSNQQRKSKFKSKLTSAQNDGSGFFSSRRGKYIISYGRLSPEQQEMQNRGGLITPSSAQKSSNNQGNDKKTFTMNPQIKAQAIEEDDEPFTFGKFIKYIMLGAIILVILFFIGSQTLSISENLKAS